jgi:hypothetical protein
MSVMGEVVSEQTVSALLTKPRLRKWYFDFRLGLLGAPFAARRSTVV